MSSGTGGRLAQLLVWQLEDPRRQYFRSSLVLSLCKTLRVSSDTYTPLEDVFILMLKFCEAFTCLANVLSSGTQTAKVLFNRKTVIYNDLQYGVVSISMLHILHESVYIYIYRYCIYIYIYT